MKFKKKPILITVATIVVFVLFVLLIVLPSYCDYTGRAQASEALKGTSGLQSDITIYYIDNNRFPPMNHKMFVNFKQNTVFKYISNQGVSFNEKTGALTITFDKGTNKGKNIQLTPKILPDKHIIIMWECDEGTIEERNFPSSCHNNID